MSVNSVSFIEDGENFSYSANEEIELYRLDEFELDANGYVRYSLSYYRSRTRNNGWQSNFGGKTATLFEERFISYSRLNKKKFLDKFLLIEAVSISILALRFAQDVKSYTELHAIFDKVTLNNRMQICKSIWKEDFPREYANLLNLRNQALHTLEERKFRYGSEYCWVDEKFNNIVKKDFNDVIKYLFEILRTLEPAVNKIQLELRASAQVWTGEQD